MYFGEPLSLSAFGFINSMFATILWVFGTYGWGLGAVSVLCFFYGTLRSLVIYDYMVTWENPEIIEKGLKDLRNRIKAKVANVGVGKAGSGKKVDLHPPGAFVVSSDV